MFPNEKTAGERLIITDPVVMEAEGEEVRVGLSFSFSTTAFAKNLSVEFFGRNATWALFGCPRIVWPLNCTHS
jgi:hypothetical protein